MVALGWEVVGLEGAGLEVFGWLGAEPAVAFPAVGAAVVVWTDWVVEPA